MAARMVGEDSLKDAREEITMRITVLDEAMTAKSMVRAYTSVQ